MPVLLRESIAAVVELSEGGFSNFYPETPDSSND